VDVFLETPLLASRRRFADPRLLSICAESDFFNRSGESNIFQARLRGPRLCSSGKIESKRLAKFSSTLTAGTDCHDGAIKCTTTLQKESPLTKKRIRNQPPLTSARWTVFPRIASKTIHTLKRPTAFCERRKGKRIHDIDDNETLTTTCVLVR